MGKNYSTFAIAQMLHVDPGSVANWVDQGLLKAYRTPGGHRRIMTADLLSFLKSHNMPVPPEVVKTPVRVMIVDDDPEVAKVIAQAIAVAHPDYEVTEVHDGFKAGAIAATKTPDVVILDLKMPGMDGYEVCRHIKSHHLMGKAQVIAMTAFPSAESQEKIIDCGARICFAKPLNLKLLLKEVQAAVNDGGPRAKGH
ncbi:MAG: response regulator [Planctomycetes bacterium]|nr:response regulator [Planctomycetota bacterium]